MYIITINIDIATGTLLVLVLCPSSSFACRCCGADEFIKLHAYTLTDYHRVVHLDADTLILHPMDELMGERRSRCCCRGHSDVHGKGPTIGREDASSFLPEFSTVWLVSLSLPRSTNIKDCKPSLHEISAESSATLRSSRETRSFPLKYT